MYNLKVCKDISGTTIGKERFCSFEMPCSMAIQKLFAYFLEIRKICFKSLKKSSLEFFCSSKKLLLSLLQIKLTLLAI